MKPADWLREDFLWTMKISVSYNVLQAIECGSHTMFINLISLSKTQFRKDMTFSSDPSAGKDVQRRVNMQNLFKTHYRIQSCKQVFRRTTVWIKLVVILSFNYEQINTLVKYAICEKAILSILCVKHPQCEWGSSPSLKSNLGALALLIRVRSRHKMNFP